MRVVCKATQDFNERATTAQRAKPTDNPVSKGGSAAGSGAACLTGMVAWLWGTQFGALYIKNGVRCCHALCGEGLQKTRPMLLKCASHHFPLVLDLACSSGGVEG